MATLTEGLKDLFWEELGREFTVEDYNAGRIKDIGARLCRFMEVHNSQLDAPIIELPLVQQQAPEILSASL